MVTSRCSTLKFRQFLSWLNIGWLISLEGIWLCEADLSWVSRVRYCHFHMISFGHHCLLYIFISYSHDIRWYFPYTWFICIRIILRHKVSYELQYAGQSLLRRKVFPHFRFDIIWISLAWVRWYEFWYYWVGSRLMSTQQIYYIYATQSYLLICRKQMHTTDIWYAGKIDFHVKFHHWSIKGYLSQCTRDEWYNTTISLHVSRILFSSRPGW